MVYSYGYPNIAKVEDAPDLRRMGEAVVLREPLATKKLGCHRLSRRVNKMATFHWFHDTTCGEF